MLGEYSSLIRFESVAASNEYFPEGADVLDRK